MSKKDYRLKVEEIGYDDIVEFILTDPMTDCDTFF